MRAMLYKGPIHVGNILKATDKEIEQRKQATMQSARDHLDRAFAAGLSPAHAFCGVRIGKGDGQDFHLYDPPLFLSDEELLDLEDQITLFTRSQNKNVMFYVVHAPAKLPETQKD